MDVFYTENQVKEFEVTLGKHNSSMNFIFGLTYLDEDMDIQNNPYVQFMGLEMWDDGRLETSANNIRYRYEFEPCTQGHLEKFITPHSISKYAQPLCFRNRDTVFLNSNQYNSDYSFPAIGLVYCKNSTDNDNWCKTKDEIAEWLLSHPRYFLSQETKAQGRIFADDPVVNKFPYYGDKENYFPTIVQ